MTQQVTCARWASIIARMICAATGAPWAAIGQSSLDKNDMPESALLLTRSLVRKNNFERPEKEFTQLDDCHRRQRQKEDQHPIVTRQA